MGKKKHGTGEDSRQPRATGKKARAKLSLVKPAEVDTYIPKYEKRACEPLVGLTAAQCRYIDFIQSKTITFGIGDAGTGKTYVCGAIGASGLVSGRIDRLILVRPAVDAGEDWGLVPGTIAEKYEPYLGPYMDVLNERLGRGNVEYFMEQGRIAPIPLGKCRGLTFRDCIVILDEAQNATKAQLKLFMTRIGQNCTMIINGDPTQCDLPANKPSGLIDAVNRVHHLPSVGLVQFFPKDIVRSGIVQEIVESYSVKTVLKSPLIGYGRREDDA